MLSFARALALDPSLLLDEPLEGLAAILVEELLCPMALVVQEEGLSTIIVEQNPHTILLITQRAMVLERGIIVHEVDSATLQRSP